jgi:hypothetical protein
MNTVKDDNSSDDSVEENHPIESISREQEEEIASESISSDVSETEENGSRSSDMDKPAIENNSNEMDTSVDNTVISPVTDDSKPVVEECDNDTDQLDIEPAPIHASDDDGMNKNPFSDGWDDVIYEYSSSDDDTKEQTPVKPAVKEESMETVVNTLLGLDDSDDSNDTDSDDVIDTTGKVLWYHCKNVSNKKDKKIIAHKDITPELIKRGFYELVGSHIQAGNKTYTQKYIRMFFDIDIKEDNGALVLYNTVIDRMNKLKELFGDYSVSGYSNIESIANEIGCAYRKNASKALSLHIVFYESRLLISDLIVLFDKMNYIIDDKLYDISVYRIGKRRVFRNHQSPHSPYGIKSYAKDGTPAEFIRFQCKDKKGKLMVNEDGTKMMTEPGKYCPGSIIGNKPLHTQLLQPIGTEKLLSLDDIHKSGVWFDMQPNISINDVKVKVSNFKIRNYISSGYSANLVKTDVLNIIMKEVNEDTFENTNDTTIDYIYSVNCLKYLLKCFDPSFDNL